MNALYPYILTLHILCAIIFLGYIFCDVVILSQIRKRLGDEIGDKASSVIVSLSCYYLGVRNPLAKSIHKIALVLGLFIVVLAKMAFYL